MALSRLQIIAALKKECSKLVKAIELLQDTNGHIEDLVEDMPSQRKKRKRMSVAARKRMSEAQKVRWAKKTA